MTSFQRLLTSLRNANNARTTALVAETMLGAVEADVLASASCRGVSLELVILSVAWHAVGIIGDAGTLAQATLDCAERIAPILKAGLV